jgi:molybdopterin-guanine dinucleotide biosynthesis protein A
VSAALAAVLAGGRSRRMGAPKASVLLVGRPLVDWSVEAARQAGLDDGDPARIMTGIDTPEDLAAAERWLG